MLLDWVFPQRCVVCSEPGDQACGACTTRFTRVRPPLCDRCGAPTAWPVRRCRECAGRRLAFASARAAVTYDDSVRAFVAGWKERGLRRLAALAAVLVVEVVEPPGVEALVPIPADPDRLISRGHHPAGALAREVGRHWQLPVVHVLARPAAGRRQRGLTLAARRRNVAKVFVLAAKPASRVALVDDVYTSGATVAAAASALRGGGARRVEVVTFARAIRLG